MWRPWRLSFGGTLIVSHTLALPVLPLHREPRNIFIYKLYTSTIFFFLVHLTSLSLSVSLLLSTACVASGAITPLPIVKNVVSTLFTMFQCVVFVFVVMFVFVFVTFAGIVKDSPTPPVLRCGFWKSCRILQIKLLLFLFILLQKPHFLVRSFIKLCYQANRVICYILYCTLTNFLSFIFTS